MSEPRRPRIYVDVREQASGVPELLRKAGLIVIEKQLPEGDYLIPEDHVVERKSVHDFVASLFDGRLFEQAQRLRDRYSDVYYIIEGDLGREMRFWRGRERQLRGALVALVADYNVKLLWSSDEQETAWYLEALARRLEREPVGAVVINKKPRSLRDVREWQLYILQAFPGIGPKTAERILERFGSIEGFVRASVSELASVEGVGESKAQRIKEILKAPYRKAPQREAQSLENFYGDQGKEGGGAASSGPSNS